MKLVLGVLVLSPFLLVGANAYAATMSGGSYTLHGGPTAITSPASTGGGYSVTPSGGNTTGASSGGSYSSTGNQIHGSSTPSDSATTGTSGSTNTNGGIGGSGSTGQSATGSSVGQDEVTISNVQVSRPSPDSIKITFDSSAPVISSVTYTVNGTQIVLMDSQPTTHHSFIINGLTPDSTYDFTILAGSAAASMYGISVQPGSLTLGSGTVTPEVTLSPNTPVYTGSTSTSTKKSEIAELSPYFIPILIGTLIILAIIGGVLWLRYRIQRDSSG